MKCRRLYLMLGLLSGGLCFIGSGGDVLYLMLGLLSGSDHSALSVAAGQAMLWSCCMRACVCVRVCVCVGGGGGGACV